MKEQQMWHIVRSILGKVVVPAALGAALCGCGDRAALPGTDTGSTGDAQTEAGSTGDAQTEAGPIAKYAAPMPDGGFAPLYAAPQPEDRYGTPFPDTDAG